MPSKAARTSGREDTASRPDRPSGSTMGSDAPYGSRSATAARRSESCRRIAATSSAGVGTAAEQKLDPLVFGKPSGQRAVGLRAGELLGALRRHGAGLPCPISPGDSFGNPERIQELLRALPVESGIVTGTSRPEQENGVCSPGLALQR